MSILAFGSSILQKLLLKKGEDYINRNFSSSDKFQSELTGVINETLEHFTKTYPKSSGEKIYFYESLEVIELLINFSFFEDFDFSGLEKHILTHDNFLPTSQEMIDDFFELFKSNVAKHDTLKKLESEFRFKDHIGKILDSLNYLTSTLSKTLKEIDHSLNGEYNRQLEEIRNNIRSFRSKTALERLQSLSQAILNKGYMSTSLQGRIFYLQGLCYEDLEDDFQIKGDLFIKAFKYIPNDPEYKVRAAIGYLNNQEKGKANDLATEILSKDEYNATAWLIKFILTNKPFAEKLGTIPKKVLDGKTFIPMLLNWLIASQMTQEGILVIKNYLNKAILEPSIPSNITFESKDYWYLISLINLFVYYEENIISYYFINRSSLLRSERLQYLNKLLQIVSSTFEETEIKSKFSTHIFYKYYLQYIFDKEAFSLSFFITAYNNIPKPLSANLNALVQVLVTEAQNVENLINQGEIKFEDNAAVFFAGCKCAAEGKDGDPSLAESFTMRTGVTSYGATDQVVLANGLKSGKLSAGAGTFIKFEKVEVAILTRRGILRFHVIKKTDIGRDIDPGKMLTDDK